MGDFGNFRRASGYGRRVSAIVALATLSAASAHAGGFYLPDNGTEPMGRGGTFVAKADSPLAMYYNVAGVARQEGIRLTIDASLIWQDMAFTRAGSYPTDSVTSDGGPAPYAGQPYPTVHNSAGVFLLPAGGVTWGHAFGLPLLDHLGFGIGVYGPPSVGKQQYGTPTTLNFNDSKGNPLQGKEYTVAAGNGSTAPAPSRYDVTDTNLLIILPTFGVAWGPVKWLEIGGAFQLVYGNFQLENANMWPNKPDDPSWDAYGQLAASGWSYGGLASILAHPVSWLDLGAQYQARVDLKATGTLTAFPQRNLGIALAPFPVTFSTTLPDKLSIGARFVSRYSDHTERADVEVDGLWEKWSEVQADHVEADNPPPPIGGGQALNVLIAHNYRDTYGLRVGGAYNFRLSDTMRLIGRAGFYFDSAASHYQDTHLDFNSAAKYAFTLGAGYKIKGFTINAAYAYVFTPDRNVTNGDLHPVSAVNGSFPSAGDASSAYIYNNGLFQYTTHIVSVGVTFNFNEFTRKTLFAN